MMRSVILALAVATMSLALPKPEDEDKPDGEEIEGVMKYLEGYGDELYKPPDPKAGDAVSAWAPSENSTNPEQLGTYVEGDIVFPETHKMRNGMRAESFRWPNGKVPYVIQGNFGGEDMANIDAAMAEYHEKTCVRFVPRTYEQDYLIILNGYSGCWSSVGRIGGPQELNIQTPGCTWKGTIEHELMHAVGFLHEQSREERDQFVTIHCENVLRGQKHNFRKATPGETTDFGVPYDYGSVMHYDAYSFSANGQPTITPNQPGVRLGQRDGLSAEDLEKINRMYKCNN